MQKWLLAGLLSFCLARSEAQSAGQTAVPQLDLNKFVGTWYEVGRLPVRAERHCVRDALVLFALDNKPGRFTLVDSCATSNGYRNIRNQSGRTANKNTTDGRLKLHKYLPFFIYSKYWVYGLAPDYSWAVVGSPNHKSLWMLTRISAPTDDTLAQMRSAATAAGFDVGKLIVVPQVREIGRPAAATPKAE